MTPAESALMVVFMDALDYIRTRGTDAQPWHMQMLDLAGEYLHPDAARQVIGRADFSMPEHSLLMDGIRERATMVVNMSRIEALESDLQWARQQNEDHQERIAELEAIIYRLGEKK